MAFNENLIGARKAKGLNQEDLAERIGISRQAVSKWETGDSLPDLLKLSVLADVLEVSIDSLCGRERPQAGTEENQPCPRRTFPRWKNVLAAIVMLAVGVCMGIWLSPEADLEPVIPMPDVITADGVNFHIDGDRLFCQFVPNVTGEEYTYQIGFVGTDGSQSVVDTSCKGGICVGEVPLTPGVSYTVSAIINKGEQSRVIYLASDLWWNGENSASWSPA